MITQLAFEFCKLQNSQWKNGRRGDEQRKNKLFTKCAKKVG